jgi:hypothetical protein
MTAGRHLDLAGEGVEISGAVAQALTVLVG